jgi:hypothetical protein
MRPVRSSPDRETFRYSLQDCSGCLYSSLSSFRGGQTLWPNLGRSLERHFVGDQELLVGNGGVGMMSTAADKLAVPAGLRPVVVRKQTGVGPCGNSIDGCGASSPTFLAL